MRLQKRSLSFKRVEVRYGVAEIQMPNSLLVKLQLAAKASEVQPKLQSQEQFSNAQLHHACVFRTNSPEL
jgi:hypothetical protein